MAGEPGEVIRGEEGPVEPRRRDLEVVGLRDRILHVEHRSDLPAHRLAVPDGDAGVAVDEDAQDRTGPGAIHLDPHELVAEPGDRGLQEIADPPLPG